MYNKDVVTFHRVRTQIMALEAKDGLCELMVHGIVCGELPGFPNVHSYFSVSSTGR